MAWIAQLFLNDRQWLSLYALYFGMPFDTVEWSQLDTSGVCFLDFACFSIFKAKKLLYYFEFIVYIKMSTLQSLYRLKDFDTLISQADKDLTADFKDTNAMFYKGLA